MGPIKLDEGQQRRADILGRLAAGLISKSDAARLLQVTEQHIYRLLASFRAEGVCSVVHGNSGRVPANRTDEETVQQILEWAAEGGKYHDFSSEHLCDLLAEAEGIEIGHSTLRRILKERGLRGAAGKPGVVRRRRERSSAEGLMVQVDGSQHDWLEGRGPRLTLLGGIDNATGKVVGALFRPTEDQAGYLMLFRAIAVDYGLPQSYYHDRHTILQSPKKATLEDELAGRQPQSEIQRVLDELGVTSIPARSPQAKGRIERLWGTWQDRLPKEMRLAGVNDLDGANTFLPGYRRRHNAHFAVDPVDPVSAWAPITADIDLAYHFSAREPRVVNADHTLCWHGRVLLILRQKGESSLARQQVAVHVAPEGDVYVYHGKQRLRYREMASRPLRPAGTPAPPAARKQPPAQDPKADARRRAWLFGGQADK